MQCKDDSQSVVVHQMSAGDSMASSSCYSNVCVDAKPLELVES